MTGPMIENHMVVDNLWPEEVDGPQVCDGCKLRPCRCDAGWDERE